MPEVIERGRVREQNTRERLLHEGARLFLERGYHGVSMREVAAAVGVTKPALYHHYADKEALFLAIMEEALGSLQGVLARTRQPQTLRGQLLTLTQELLQSAPRQRVGLQLAGELKHISAPRRADFERHYREVWMGGLAQLMAQAAQRGELRRDLPPAVLTTALLGLLYPLVSRPAGPESGALAEGLVDIFLGGAAMQEGS